MTEAIEGEEASRLAYVVDLATTLADRILDAQIGGRPVQLDQLSALVAAARLLQNLGVPWPPLVDQVLHELADNLGRGAAPEVPEPKTSGDPAVAGLSRFLGAFRRDKSSRAEA